MANKLSGMLPDAVSNSIEFIKIFPRPPIQSLPSEKARLYPIITQIIETMQARAKCCIKTETTFLEFTNPA